MLIPGIFFLLTLAAGLPLTGSSIPPKTANQTQSGAAQADLMPDISGLAWCGQDTFLAVHDAKNPEENDRPRVSLLRLPSSAEGLSRRTLEVEWPAPLMESSDLESVARIPGTPLYLLAESGESSHTGRDFRRVFLAELENERLEILSSVRLPGAVTNVEGSAVAKLGGRLIFVWGERGDGQARTKISWAELSLGPLKLGPPRQAYFRPGALGGRNWRPVSAIEIDRHGVVYIASAQDPGDDNGPFASIVWRAGRVTLDRAGRPGIRLFSTPGLVAKLDGLKVEAVAIREEGRDSSQLFVGVDDENYGGALRPLPLWP